MVVQQDMSVEVTRSKRVVDSSVAGDIQNPVQEHAHVLPALMRHRGWSVWHFVGAVVLALLGIVATYKVWVDVAYIAWTHEESSHILLVAIAVPWMVGSNLGAFGHCYPRRFWIGAVMVCIGAFTMIYGWDHHYMNTLWRMGALLVVLGCVVSCLGGDVLWRFLPAFVAMGFVLPMPGTVKLYVSHPLQTAMASISQEVAHVFGFMIERSGNVLIVEGQKVEVAEACNGMRMVFGLLLVCYTFAFVTPLRWPIRVLILLGTPIFALVSNVFRLVPTILMYAYESKESADQFHDAAGWAMLPLGLLALFGLLKFMEWLGIPVLRPSSKVIDSETDMGQGDLHSKEKRLCGERLGESDRGKVGLGRSLKGMACWGLVSVVMLGLLTRELSAREMPQDAAVHHSKVVEVSKTSPTLIGGEWKGGDVEVPDYAREILQPNVMLHRRYKNLRTGKTVSFLMVQCKDARDMVFHYPPICYKYAGWEKVGAKVEWFEIEGEEVEATEYRFKMGFPSEQEIVIWNVMILPDGTLSPAMDSVHGVANDPKRRFYGAGQLQLIFDSDMRLARRREIFEQFVLANEKLIFEMKRGRKHEKF